MPMNIDRQLRERMAHDTAVFPISFFEDEFLALPTRSIPLHWHPEFEFVTASSGVLEVQVGQALQRLEAGDSLLINGNVLHAMRQVEGERPDAMPNIVFSGTLIAPEGSAIHDRYIRPIAASDDLPFILFRRGAGWHDAVNDALAEVYRQLRDAGACHEMAVQRQLSGIFEAIFRHLEELPRTGATRVQLAVQVRLQQMLAFIRAHYAENITLADIAAAASVSKSEANRCFNAYMNCTPIDALIQYRLETARRLLGDSTRTIREISEACGFNSESYFSRRYRRVYGCAPGQGRS